MRAAAAAGLAAALALGTGGAVVGEPAFVLAGVGVLAVAAGLELWAWARRPPPPAAEVAEALLASVWADDRPA